MKTKTHNFKESSLKGIDSEELVFNWLKAAGYEVDLVGQRLGKWSDSEFKGEYNAPDFAIRSHYSGTPRSLVGKTVELKSDSLAHETGNLPFEIVSNVGSGRPGWVYSLSADFIAFYLVGSGELLLLAVPDLKKAIEDKWQHYKSLKAIRNPLFTGVVILVPVEEVRKLALLRADLGGSKDGEKTEADVQQETLRDAITS